MYDAYDPTDPDAPQPEDIRDQDDDDDLTEECPHCGAAVYEGAAVCAKCGYWISDASPAERRAQGWFWPVMIALLIAVMLVMWHGLGM